jgi:hypothetical protein
VAPLPADAPAPAANGNGAVPPPAQPLSDVPPPPAELERVALPDEACRQALLLRRTRMEQAQAEYAAYLLGLADALGVGARLVDADVRAGELLLRPLAQPTGFAPYRPPTGLTPDATDTDTAGGGE